MVNPYRAAGRAGAKLKFRKMLGTDKGAKHLNDDTVVNPKAKVTKGVDDVKIMGGSVPKRLDRKSGGRVKPNIININIGKQGQDQPPINPLAAMAALKPPMPPQGPPPMPPGGMRPPMPMPPGGMPMGGATMPAPGAGLPMPRKRGGQVKKRDSGGFLPPVNIGTGSKGGAGARYQSSLETGYPAPPKKKGGKVVCKKSGGGMTGGPIGGMYGITAPPSSGEGRIQLGKLQRKQKGKQKFEKPGK